MAAQDSRNTHWRRNVISSLALVAMLAGVAFLITWRSVTGSADKTLAAAQQLIEQGKTSEVRETLSLLLWFQPENPDALFLRGASFFMDRDFSAAVQSLQQVKADSTAYGAASITLARAFLELKRQDKAEAVLQDHLSAIPRSDPARQALTELYMQQLRKRDAVNILEERARLFPDDLTVFRGLLLLDSQKTTPNSRLPDLEAADAACPNQLPVIRAIAKANLLLGRIDTAREYYTAAVAHPDADLQTTLDCANFHAATGDAAAAASLLDAIDQQSIENNDQYWAIRSRVCELNSEFEQALSALDRAITLHPSDIEYFNAKAGLLRQSGQVAAAEQAAREAEGMTQASRDLFLLVDKSDIDQPTQEMCQKLVTIYDAMNLPQRASAWRTLSEYFETVPPQ